MLDTSTHPPLQGDKRVSIKMPARTHERVKHIAKVRDQSVSELITGWVELRLHQIDANKPRGRSQVY
jgi:hypothetical protein